MNKNYKQNETTEKKEGNFFQNLKKFSKDNINKAIQKKIDDRNNRH